MGSEAKFRRRECQPCPRLGSSPASASGFCHQTRTRDRSRRLDEFFGASNTGEFPALGFCIRASCKMVSTSTVIGVAVLVSCLLIVEPLLGDDEPGGPPALLRHGRMLQIPDHERGRIVLGRDGSCVELATEEDAEKRLEPDPSGRDAHGPHEHDRDGGHRVILSADDGPQAWIVVGDQVDMHANSMWSCTAMAAEAPPRALRATRSNGSREARSAVGWKLARPGCPRTLRSRSGDQSRRHPCRWTRASVPPGVDQPDYTSPPAIRLVGRDPLFTLRRPEGQQPTDLIRNGLQSGWRARRGRPDSPGS